MLGHFIITPYIVFQGLEDVYETNTKQKSHGRVEHSFSSYLCEYSKVAMASLGAERGMWMEDV